jgi:hypothetical protein
MTFVCRLCGNFEALSKQFYVTITVRIPVVEYDEAIPTATFNQAQFPLHRQRRRTR